MRITTTQTRAAYSAAKRVHEGKLTPQAASRRLERNHGRNSRSARDFIVDFRCMMRGQTYYRTMNRYSTEYFLKSIYSDFGFGGLRPAVDAVRSHIVYYESLRGTKLLGIRRIEFKYSKILSQDQSLASLQFDFERRVARSSKSSPASRKRRLRKAAKKPKKVVVTTEVFARNPDVVAEVLARAGGICERCERPAPFFRARNDEPYLEVHHIVQLAHNGDDVVDNALALCPNCYRELHYGRVDT